MVKIDQAVANVDVTEIDFGSYHNCEHWYEIAQMAVNHCSNVVYDFVYDMKVKEILDRLEEGDEKEYSRDIQTLRDTLL